MTVSGKPTTTRTRSLALAGFAVALAGLLLLVPLPRAWQGGWRSKLLDLGHVPLFAVLTFALRPAGRGPWHRPALLAVALAGLAELLQAGVGRSADFYDFLRGAAGALAAGLVLRAWQGPRTAGRLAVHALAALALLAWPVADAAPRLLDAWEGRRDFPTLADFATRRQLLRWQGQQATLTRVADPTGEGGWVGRVEFLPGPSPYPGAALEPVERDWARYSRLCWSFAVEGRPLTLVFSVRGQGGHYQTEKTFGPGEHVFELDLALAAERSRPGPLDLSDVRLAQVFIVRPKAPRIVYLRRVWLE
jgi:hypothetical protein